MQKEASRAFQFYTRETILYGIMGILGIWWLIDSLVTDNTLLLLISALIIYVSWDNFFCGSRAKKCGLPITTHYTIPPFLKRKKN